MSDGVEEEDPWKVLKLERDASTSEIETAFRKLSRLCHPDKCPNDPDAKRKFERIRAAKSQLFDVFFLRRYLTPAVCAEVMRKRKQKDQMEAVQAIQKQRQEELQHENVAHPTTLQRNVEELATPVVPSSTMVESHAKLLCASCRASGAPLRCSRCHTSYSLEFYNMNNNVPST